ncbi:hypothetical protein [Filimonas effusa]|uniref:Uncharacterized protein n=1 Tax=Filimonas effusa TaxID=2508721 RepID=A0A4Q1DC46_9BACT|nr:hypothetical protein [Filimonas effusa]RXK87012.1 hypothetical protein ESB13_09580 [Filimonas effusa]
MDFKFNRLARVQYANDEIHQQYEGDGLTGHDTLIIGCAYKNDFWLSLWVDMGVGGLPVAMRHQSDNEITVTAIYHKTSFAAKLTDTEIAVLFNHVFDNPGQIDIIKE